MIHPLLTPDSFVSPRPLNADFINRIDLIGPDWVIRAQYLGVF